MNVPDTFRLASIPDDPAEPGKVKAVVPVVPAEMLPILTGSDVAVAAAPRAALVIVTLEAAR